MRYDLTIPIKNLEGVQIADAETPAGLTLRTVLARTALWVIRHKPPSALEKLAAYALAKRISTAGDSIELSAEDVVKLKELAGDMWQPLVLGQVWELLETPSGPTQTEQDALAAVLFSHMPSKLNLETLRRRGAGELPTADIPSHAVTP